MLLEVRLTVQPALGVDAERAAEPPAALAAAYAVSVIDLALGGGSLGGVDESVTEGAGFATASESVDGARGHTRGHI